MFLQGLFSSFNKSQSITNETLIISIEDEDFPDPEPVSFFYMSDIKKI